MPTDFNQKSHKNQNESPRETSNATSKQTQRPEIATPEVEKTPTSEEKTDKENYRDLFLRGLPEPEIARVKDLIGMLLDSNFLLEAMFNTNATFEFPLNKHITLTVRGMSNSERTNLGKYLVGKDPFNLFKEEDDAEIENIMHADPDLTLAQARELFLRTFHQSTAEERRDKVLLALNVVKLNGKPIGENIEERFRTLEGMSAMLIGLMQSSLGLLDRAINLALIDSDILKN